MLSFTGDDSVSLASVSRTRHMRLDIQQALFKVGGFGKFQIYAMIVLSLSLDLEGALQYAYPLLEMKPAHYKCFDSKDGTYQNCDNAQYCD